MTKLPVELSIGILDSDVVAGGTLKVILASKEDVRDVKQLPNATRHKENLDVLQINAIFVDIFSIGVDNGVAFIETVRRDHPEIAFCLYSSQSDLYDFPGVAENWRKRFQHYFKLAKDQPLPMLESSVDRVLLDLAYDIQASLARRKLSDLRGRIQREPKQPETQRMVETIESAEKALEARRERETTMIVPGMTRQRFEQYVDETLIETKRHSRQVMLVNVVVLAIGAIILLCSFIFTLFAPEVKLVAFGGLGVASMVAALITNPLKSIRADTGRL